VIEATNYSARRALLREKLGNAIAVIPSASHQTRSYDTEYSFRQHSVLKYLTGLEEQDSILVLCPNNIERPEVLFVRPKDAMMEMWSGKRLGPERAREILEIQHVYPIDQFDTILPELMLGHTAIAYDLFDASAPQSLHKRLLDHAEKLQRTKRKFHVRKPDGVINLATLTGEMRLIKEGNELLFMREAQKITSRAHRAVMAKTAAGINEKELQALFHYIVSKNGATEAYESIVAGGENACILHYVNNNKKLKDGDLLLIDAGSEFHVYASDVTRTYPVNGKFTPIQRDVYEIVLSAQKEAISLSRPGKNLNDLHQATITVLSQGLKDLKVINESVETILEKELYKPFYPHSTSHWMGLDVHDPCPYLDGDLKPVSLREGMVFTIEPGLYFPPDRADLPTELRGMGIRIEDDILITDRAYENLSSSIPKEISEIEEEMKRDYRDFL